MYDIDRPKFVFVSLLEDFIRETEHSLAYFFALLIFLSTFLLALFGREALYTGLIGVLCLFLIKLRDFIDGFKETRQNIFFYPPENKRKNPPSDETVFSVTAGELPRKADKDDLRQADFPSYLHQLRDIAETVGFFLPDLPLSAETKRAVEKTATAAQAALISYLEKKYALTEERKKEIEDLFSNDETDPFLLQIRLEKAGMDEKTAKRIADMAKLLKKIRNKAGADKPEQQTADRS